MESLVGFTFNSVVVTCRYFVVALVVTMVFSVGRSMGDCRSLVKCIFYVILADLGLVTRIHVGLHVTVACAFRSWLRTLLGGAVGIVPSRWVAHG